MKLRMLLSVLPVCLLGSEAAFTRPPGRVVQRVVHSAGFVEPHTPGSGAAEEVAATPGIEALLGAPVSQRR